VLSRSVAVRGADTRTRGAVEPIVAAVLGEDEGAQPGTRQKLPARRLARPLEQERVWAPDRDAMVAALRVVLGLPRQLPDRGQRGIR